MKLADFRQKAIETLTNAGIERPAYVIDLFIAHFANVSREYLLAHADYEAQDNTLKEIDRAINLRIKRVPVSYIIGEAEFYGHKFKVGSGCLIPRPETELLVENMLELAPRNGYFADWCTGSGCIAIAMLLERNDLNAVAVDASIEALKWAEENRKLYSLENRLQLLQNSNPNEISFERKFVDYIVANPPYIAQGEMNTLMKDVLEYEPSIALNGGQDGVELYELLFETLPNFVKSGGYIGFEIAGERQAEILKKIAPDCLKIFREIKDYNGILRHLIWKRT